MTSTAISISKQKQVLQELAAAYLTDDYLEYRDKVRADGDIEDYRKLNELNMKLTGAEMERRIDQNAHLATFNFVFNNGIKATITEHKQEVLETLEDVTPQPAAQPDIVDAQIKVVEVPPQDVDALLSGLDEMNIY